MSDVKKCRNLFRPSRTVLIFIGALLLLALGKESLPLLHNNATVWEANLNTVLQALAISMVALLLLDLLFAFTQKIPQIERTVPDILPVGHWVPVTLRVTNPGTTKLRFVFKDHLPHFIDTELQASPLKLNKGQQLIQSTRMRARKRGNFKLGPVQLLINSPLGLWQRSIYQQHHFSIKVYPDFASVQHFALLLQDNLQGQTGVKLLHRRGEGLDFQQLREYRQGDSLRQLDWKATARVHKLISREYQDERDQTIFFVLDCGRRMRAKDGDLSHFDHALNAMLLLSSVALRQGDSVGLLAFGGTPRFLSPIRSLSNMNTLLNAIYDLESTPQASDYQQAALDFLQNVKRRSLVIYVTNIRNENFSEVMSAVALLKKNHIVLIANLQESILEQNSMQMPQDFDEALSWVEVNHYLSEQEKNNELLKAQAVTSIRTTPDKLPISLVNAYWEIKRAGKL
ncbi:MAG TPA: DUF58 domain-containing protein [Pseudomonadales bacterium]|nr:DUF58 domain-containing protein [Pseudomonadales bacterium]